MKKDNILKLLVVLINLIVVVRLFDVGVLKHELYKSMNDDIQNNYVVGSSAPRGRILDINGKILVDNKGIKELTLKKTNDLDQKDIIVKLAQILEFKGINLSDVDLKRYYYYLNKEEIDSLMDKKMIDKYKSMQITSSELEEYKFTFIDSDKLKEINEKEAHIYKIINTGYSFTDKVIKSDISEEELQMVNELHSDNLVIKVNWVRNYNYDTVFNQIFGSLGAIEEENVGYYLNNGYSLDDVVGVSFLEKYYESVLRGQKALYKYTDDGLELVREEKRGTDIVLGVDIDKQLEIEAIVKEEIENAKKYPSSKFFKGSYVVVSEPSTGVLKYLVGFNANQDYSSDLVGLFTNSFTVGSVVKGASQSVAYINGVIEPNKKITDACVKLKNMPSKCSWARLGSINDIDALAQSSNYYQFINAIKVSGNTYSYNMAFNPTEEDFEKYRSVFKSYGLGDLTGVDLYEEKLGIRGTRISGDLLLNYVIGQYDTYTPLMLSSYINTLANNGVRKKLRIALYGIDDEGNKVSINEDEEVARVDINEEDLNRVKLGLRKVIESGTASSYVDPQINASGKTGTSETFFEGIPTTTRSFIMFAPSDEPKYSMVIVSPNLAYTNSANNYKYPINSRLSRKISNILFEK